MPPAVTFRQRRLEAAVSQEAIAVTSWHKLKAAPARGRTVRLSPVGRLPFPMADVLAYSHTLAPPTDMYQIGGLAVGKVPPVTDRRKGISSRKKALAFQPRSRPVLWQTASRREVTPPSSSLKGRLRPVIRPASQGVGQGLCHVAGLALKRSRQTFLFLDVARRRVEQAITGPTTSDSGLSAIGPPTEVVARAASPPLVADRHGHNVVTRLPATETVFAVLVVSPLGTALGRQMGPDLASNVPPFVGTGRHPPSCGPYAGLSFDLYDRPSSCRPRPPRPF